MALGAIFVYYHINIKNLFSKYLCYKLLLILLVLNKSIVFFHLSYLIIGALVGLLILTVNEKNFHQNTL